MAKTASTTSEGPEHLLARDLSRLLASALDVETPGFDAARAVQTRAPAASPAHWSPAFPIWGVATSAACLAILAGLRCIAPHDLAIPRILAIAVPLANVAMAPIAAIAVVKGRKTPHAN